MHTRLSSLILYILKPQYKMHSSHIKNQNSSPYHRNPRPWLSIPSRSALFRSRRAPGRSHCEDPEVSNQSTK
jgi:hypothetical protein